jgi:hypothetical protein
MAGRSKDPAERARKRRATGDRPASGIPAKGPRPPFPTKHGARSEKLVMPRARELAPAILDDNPQLDAKRDGAAITRYAVVLARIERVYMWLAEQDDAVFESMEDGSVHRVYDQLRQWEKQADAAEDRLAIAPLTRARLGLDLQKAQANEAEREAARAARDRLDARLAEIDGG